ncbi:MAG: VWA domain-containing protein [Actinomycetota bacterium]
MIDAVVGLASLLRRDGIGVGSDRTVLAARSLAYVDLADREATKRALRFALVLHGSDEERFDELFEQWFDDTPLTVDAPASDVALEEVDDDLPDGPLVDMRAATSPEAYVDDPEEQIGVSTQGDDSERRRGHTEAAGADDAEVVSRFDSDDSVGRVDSTELSSVAERDADGEAADAVLIELADDDAVDDIAAMRRMIDDAHRDRLTLLAPAAPSPSPSGRPNSLLANPFDRDEQRALDTAVRALWPQLTGAPSWRTHLAPTGRLDLRRTLRSSATFGGVPISIRHRSPATNRPDLLVLVDTSVSMRPTVRLMLHLAHALRRRPGRVQVLAFVDQCVDVTDVIRHADLASALGALLDDAPGGPLDPARPSDYGVALQTLWHRYARLLRPSTTVLVLGDGRSSGRDPGFDHVADLTDRCRRTVWCSPEPEGAWSFGNAEMAGYASRVDAAVSVRSLDDLAAAIARGVFRSDANSGRSVLDRSMLDRSVVAPDEQPGTVGMPHHA